MKRSAEKKERALGMKLFLKGGRCNSPKCATIRRPYRPGMHGKGRRRVLSEYGMQLMEKQRVKVSYGLREIQLTNIVNKALKGKGNTGETIVKLLESQFSNVIFRLGLASSRVVARQLISHGHIFVNGKKMTASSYSVEVGDVISIKPSSRQLLIFNDLPNIIKKYEAPNWLELDKEKLEGKVKNSPINVEMPFDINLIIDSYSK